MKHAMLTARWVFLLAIAAPVACLPGCSGGRPSGSVSGTVTLGGSPLTAGLVLFSNQATGVGVTAELDASGRYEIGAIPTGEYQVAIEPPPLPAPHEMDQVRAPRDNIPPKYKDLQTSGLTAIVESRANTIDFAL